MLMYNEKYADLYKAFEYPDGLEVVSTMFAVSECCYWLPGAEHRTRVHRPSQACG